MCTKRESGERGREKYDRCRTEKGCPLWGRGDSQNYIRIVGTHCYRYYALMNVHYREQKAEKTFIIYHLPFHFERGIVFFFFSFSQAFISPSLVLHSRFFSLQIIERNLS